VSYNMKSIRENVPIADVVDALGLHNNGRKLRCWRPGHEDEHPSVGIDKTRNRVKCFRCDSKQLSNIDLVASVLNLSTYEASVWIGDRFGLTKAGVKIGKPINRAMFRQKYWTQSLYKAIPDNVRALIERILHPSWEQLKPVAVKVYLTLTARILANLYASKSLSATICLPELMKASGMGKGPVLRGIRQLEKAKLIKIIPASKGARQKGECNSYSLTWLNKDWANTLQPNDKKPAKPKSTPIRVLKSQN
jgi:hypothetical protein